MYGCLRARENPVKGGKRAIESVINCRYQIIHCQLSKFSS